MYVGTGEDGDKCLSPCSSLLNRTTTTIRLNMCSHVINRCCNNWAATYSANIWPFHFRHAFSDICQSTLHFWCGTCKPEIQCIPSKNFHEATMLFKSQYIKHCEKLKMQNWSLKQINLQHYRPTDNNIRVHLNQWIKIPWMTTDKTTWSTAERSVYIAVSRIDDRALMCKYMGAINGSM